MLENLIKIEDNLKNLNAVEYNKGLENLKNLAYLSDLSREFEIYLRIKDIINNLMKNDKNAFWDELFEDCNFDMNNVYNQLEKALNNILEELGEEQDSNSYKFYREQLELLENI